ncbi:ABC transporter ATP-binding protein [Sinirhodobacter populi]|uniref:ABC transporter ATP-binding protein n=1 Tax=Paenirhodobacter populi TaxID=2306993 RepID=A0A443KNY2_9RHOB|nr:ABC transporter ATP-binding protein [Sinirhodobacter populi]RWR34618.1 ABC transporter ATP-binding protein [Sinirhodobacter populi]
MLAIESVGKTYDNGTEALRGIDLSIGGGEIVALVGGSGCGKSTLLRLIGGLDRATRGRIRAAGRDITEPVQNIGLVFQEPRLLPWLTVAQNIAFGIRDLPRAERDARVAKLLSDIRLPDYGNRWPKELSGGQAQRVAIARALAPAPDILLLDEPFSALDAFTRAELQDHLIDLWQKHRRTFVIVTHDIEEAVALADRVVIMRPHPGRIARELDIPLPHPRDRSSDAFAQAERRVRQELDSTILHAGV